MKKWFLLCLCLLLCGCTATPAPQTAGVPAAELLPQRSYTLQRTELEEISPLGAPMVQQGNTLYYIKGETLFALSLQDGSVLALLENPHPLTDHVATERMQVQCLAVGEHNTLWTAEQVTPIIDEAGEPVEHPTPYLRMRCRTSQGITLTTFPAPQVEGPVLAMAHQGDTLAIITPQNITYLRTDGELLTVRPFSDPLYAMVSYGDGYAILTEGERGRAALLPLDLLNFTDLARIPLPFSPDAVSYAGERYRLPVFAQGNSLLFPCEGNLFSCEISTGKVQKLADWLDYDVNPVYVVYETLLDDGSVVALQWENNTLTHLRLSPAETASTEHTLTLAMLSTDLPALRLVMDYNLKHPTARLRVVNYGEYAAFGLSPRSQFSRNLAAGTAGDMVFSSNRDMPVTELAAGNLLNLSPYLSSDETLRQEGVFQSVLAVQKGSEQELYSIAPRFVLSTALSTRKMAGTGTLTVSRAMNLYTLYGASSAQERFLRQETVLREHIARNSLAYGIGEHETFSFNNTTFQDGLLYASLFPESIDFSNDDFTAGWRRVREGTQLLLTGQYYDFSALSRDLYAVGDDAVICGFPDVVGGHVLELWETYGLLRSCNSPETAWDFLRTVLLADNLSEDSGMGFPANLTAFARMGQKAMKTQGETILVDGQMALSIPAALSQEQYNAVLTAVNGATARYENDEEVFVALWPEAQRYFDGEQDLSTTAARAQTAAENYRNVDYNG